MKLDKKGARVVAAVTVLTLGLIGAYVLARPAEPQDRVIKITAKRFNYTPGEVKLRKGVPVVLEFRTQDVMMGFNLPDFGVRADIVPDKVTRLRLVPDKVGTFVFLCDIFCGSGHETMNGKIIVVE